MADVQQYVEEMLANVQRDDLRYERSNFYIWASIMAWGFFWELAERQHDQPHAQYLVWTLIFVVMWAMDVV